MLSKPPRGTYLLAALLLPCGILCEAILLLPVFYLFGFDPQRGLLIQPGYEWFLVVSALMFLLLCYGVVCLARVHPLARGFSGDVGGAVLRPVLAPVESPSERRTQVYVVRGALGLLFLGCGVWMLRPSFRSPCKTYRKQLRWPRG